MRKILKSSVLEKIGCSAILFRNLCSAFLLVSMKSSLNLSTIPFITNFSGSGWWDTIKSLYYVMVDKTFIRGVKLCLKGIRTSSTHKKKLYQHICMDKWIYKLPCPIDFHNNCVHSSRMFDKQETCTLHLHEQWAWDEPLPDVPSTTGSLGIAFAPQTHSRQTRSVWSDVRKNEGKNWENYSQNLTEWMCTQICHTLVTTR